MAPGSNRNRLFDHLEFDCSAEVAKTNRGSSRAIENALTDILRRKYSPTAVLLHGSRAVGKERDNSDWDTAADAAALTNP